MDRVDKFNNTVLDIILNWKNIFYFALGICFLSPILYFGRNSNIAMLIIFWVILVIVAIVMHIVLRGKRSEPEEKEPESQFTSYTSSKI